MITLGIVDFDSSHSVEFTRRINRCEIASEQFVEGAKISLGYPGSSETTRGRAAAFTPQIVRCGVELVDDPRAMIGRIDGVMILSLAGDRHLEAVRPFLEAGVPAYVDKPIACRTGDLDEMIALAERSGTALWSSSAARFCDDVVDVKSDLSRLGAMSSLQVYGPAHRSDVNPGMFHYAIHIAETMYALMGTGCERLSALSSDGCDLVGARWSDGRIASIRGHRTGNTGYGCTCFTEHGILQRNISLRTAYRNLCRKIVEAFTFSIPPVPLVETREIVRFLEAAEYSRANDALPVSLN
jgi:hypothetical protein